VDLDKLVLLVARPIRDSLAKAEPAGMVVMGRVLNSSRVRRLSNVVHLSLALHPVAGLEPGSGLSAVLDELLRGTPCAIRTGNDICIRGYRLVPDVLGRPGLILRVAQDRDIFQQGQRTLRYLTVAVTLACICFALLTLLLIEWFVLRRMRTFSLAVRSMTLSGDFSGPIPAGGGDELESLARDLNRMLDTIRAADLALGESRRRLVSLMSNLVGMAYRCRNDRDWTMEFVSDGCRDLTGYSPHQLVDNTEVSFGSLIVPEDAAGVWEAVQQGVAAGSKYEMTYRIRTASGEVRWVWEQGNGVFSEEGALVALEGFISDVTQQKQVEAELEAARCSAEEASSAKTMFLANMSHEIRTPMTAILGYADLVLEEQALGGDAREHVAIIRNNGRHLLSVINDILDLSRIEANRLVVERVVFSPASLIAEVESLMQARARQRGLEFHVEYRGPVPETICTDPVRLRQILLNLVGNAIKFTDHGEVRVVTELLDASGPRPRLQVEVIDTGMGMSEEQLAVLFEPFRQVDMSAARRFGGTGLGLSISKRLAAMLDGEISVTSRPGAGSTFRVTVGTGSLEGIRLLGPAEGLGRECPADLPGPVAALRLRGRILLAEDGPDNRRLISFILKRAGLDLEMVEDGSQAVETALRADREGCPFDLILMDMQMPVLDGYGAVRQLRRAGYIRPIIALTAHAMASDRDKCLACGCNGFASKPVDRQELFRLIGTFVRPDPVPEAAPARG
jgi:PAS domain S-box-containing protein